MIYFGLSLHTSYLAGNNYINFGISGLLELPANLVGQLSLTKVGRRLTLSVSMIACGVVLFATLFVQEGKLSIFVLHHIIIPYFIG